MKMAKQQRYKYGFHSDFEFAQNLLKLGLPTLLMWKDVPVIFFLQARRKSRHKCIKVHPPNLFVPKQCGIWTQTLCAQMLRHGLCRSSEIIHAVDYRPCMPHVYTESSRHSWMQQANNIPQGNWISVGVGWGKFLELHNCSKIRHPVHQLWSSRDCCDKSNHINTHAQAHGVPLLFARMATFF